MNPMGLRLLCHDGDEGCGEFLDMDGGCLWCGYCPDLPSVSSKEISAEGFREGMVQGRTYLTPEGMKICGWVEPDEGGLREPGTLGDRRWWCHVAVGKKCVEAP